MKEKIIPIASIAVGLVAFILTTQYWKSKQADINQEWLKLKSASERVEVMMARRDIPEGDKLRASDIEPVKKLKSEVRADAMDKYDAYLALGRKTLFPVKKGDFITWSHIEGGSPDAMGLAATIKPGMRAISIDVAGSAAVSGMVRPNDRIDVLGTFAFPSPKNPTEMQTVTLTVLQDVTILATGQSMARDRMDPRKRQATTFSTVTLEVTTREAELLVFAQQSKGRLSLSLRNSSDVGYEKSMPSVNFDHIQTKLDEYNRTRQFEILHKPK